MTWLKLGVRGLRCKECKHRGMCFVDLAVEETSSHN